MWPLGVWGPSGQGGEARDHLALVPVGMGRCVGQDDLALTGLSLQVIDSDDLSEEKIRVKETVEGEWWDLGHIWLLQLPVLGSCQVPAGAVMEPRARLSEREPNTQSWL